MPNASRTILFRFCIFFPRAHKDQFLFFYSLHANFRLLRLPPFFFVKKLNAADYYFQKATTFLPVNSPITSSLPVF